MLAKKYKKKFMNYLKKMCDDSKIKNKSLGLLIRSIHLNMPFNILLVACLAPKCIVLLVTLLFFISASFFILFDGCFLSRLEYYLTKEDFTIVDPFLEMANIKITNSTRNLITHYGMTYYMSIYIFIFYMRFIYKKKII